MLPDDSHSLFTHLRSAYRAASNEYRARLKDFDLTPPQATALSFIGRNPGQGVRALAGAIDIDLPTRSVLVTRRKGVGSSLARPIRMTADALAWSSHLPRSTSSVRRPPRAARPTPRWQTCSDLTVEHSESFSTALSGNSALTRSTPNAPPTKRLRDTTGNLFRLRSYLRYRSWSLLYAKERRRRAAWRRPDAYKAVHSCAEVQAVRSSAPLRARRGLDASCRALSIGPENNWLALVGDWSSSSRRSSSTRMGTRRAVASPHAESQLSGVRSPGSKAHALAGDRPELI